MTGSENQEHGKSCAIAASRDPRSRKISNGPPKRARVDPRAHEAALEGRMITAEHVRVNQNRKLTKMWKFVVPFLRRPGFWAEFARKFERFASRPVPPDVYSGPWRSCQRIEILERLRR